ncbi:MAG TPA: hypothetical protein VHE33_12440 [Acidobacteriaceae bacterium]|jgi:hypothetical protein|nr:hypothetical protein [Acidobacteriaceae bacterium]
MKMRSFVIPAVLVTAIFAIVLPLTVRAAGHHDFDAVVSAVEHQYDARPQRIPMMGFVSFCGWVATGGGVKGLKIAEFDHFAGPADPAELDKLVDSSLGAEWQRFVANRERNGELNLIYAQPDGHAMRMLIVDYEHGELDVVRVEVNADRLQHWMKDPGGSAKRHDYGTERPD